MPRSANTRSGADYIRDLLNDRSVNLLSFDQHEAYHRRFRFLAPVTVPAGLVNLGQNIPGKDVSVLAPTAMLVVRKDFHPALVPLLLTTAARIHGKGDELSDPGEFPAESYCDFPVSEDAKRYYKSGQPVLQRLLPFWLASLVDRAKVMLIPVIMLMMPLIRAAPPLMRWRTRRKIYLWYSDLREIDQRLITGLSGPELDQELARLKGIEHQVAYVDVPLSYMEEFYHLRLHLAMLQEHLIGVQTLEQKPVLGAKTLRRKDCDLSYVFLLIPLLGYSGRLYSNVVMLSHTFLAWRDRGRRWSGCFMSQTSAYASP